MKNKYWTWQCNICNKVFKTRALLYKHWKEFPDHHIKKSTANKSKLYKCKYCEKEWITTLPGLHIHENCCKENPNRIKYKTHKLSDDQKQQLSNIMKEKHRLGLACTLSDLRRKEKPSYPEQWLINVIENEKLNNNYIREYRFHTFSLDFVWLDKKKVIEMDGRFHKIFKYQQDCDKRKDQLLKDEGWEELRIDWEYCCNNTKEIIKQIRNFIGERN